MRILIVVLNVFFLQKGITGSGKLVSIPFIDFPCATAVLLCNKWNIDTFLLTDTSHFVIIFHT